MIWATSIWKLGCSNRSKIHSVQKCYLCLRYVVSPMSPGRTRFKWWAWVDLNHRPRPYQGLLCCYMHSIVFIYGSSSRKGDSLLAYSAGRIFHMRLVFVGRDDVHFGL